MYPAFHMLWEAFPEQHHNNLHHFLKWIWHMIQHRFRIVDLLNKCTFCHSLFLLWSGHLYTCFFILHQLDAFEHQSVLPKQFFLKIKQFFWSNWFLTHNIPCNIEGSWFNPKPKRRKVYLLGIKYFRIERCHAVDHRFERNIGRWRKW